MSSRQRSHIAEPQDTRDLRSMSERILREQFEEQPAHVQRETRERVIDRLREPRTSATPSALMRLAESVYGINVNDI